MMIILFSQTNAGATFLDWSLHWLTAQENHYSCSGVISSVIVNPIKDINAHGHPKNSSFLKRDPNFDRQYELLFSRQAKKDIKILHLFGQYSPKEEISKLEQCGGRGDRLIVMTSNFDFYRDAPRAMPHGYYDFAYHTQWVMESWPKLGHEKIKTPGLMREFLCFNGVPACRDAWEEGIILSDYFPCSKVELIGDGEHILRDCIQWLGLSVDESRMPAWREVASQWRGAIAMTDQQKHNWSCMVESVVAGADFECGQLTLAQEAALMHDVIVATKGRMMRARSLDRLPTNAKEIHRLIW